ncbi:methyl-accepting chemotaxis protein [Geomesophilobacter sediminis]|uniref:Methyl-accepting chemotaxis protein n=1 Tax=Geomesophilobacter sediminis TaxID=2798584 RepID=A0A8J7LXS8_9BACT|nr:HAMP domain-containing methyl-accepting chemotaxis protein [Geomesophilobacter sediminis]MBJ6723631.1 methyl-accepting chemotaxis protein [Geomesophilobacter sediminis]
MEKSGISRFSVLQLVVFLTVVSVVGLITLSIGSFSVIKQVKVTGPIYQQIVQGKDLVADILPPPEYVIESYLVVLEAGRETDSSKIPQYLERFKKLKADFEERHTYWQKELADGEIKQLIVEGSYRPGEDFYQTALNDYFPALQQGDAAKAGEAFTKLSASYEAHRQQIDKLVTATNAQNDKIEKDSGRLLGTITMVLLVLCVAVLGICIGLSGFVIKSITSSIRACTSITDRIARGDLSVEVPVEGRGSVRVMLESLKSMVETFRSIVTQVGSTSQMLVDTSINLSTASEQIAGNAENVAAESTSIAAAGEQMASTSHEISDSCHHAAENSRSTSAAASAGVEVVANTITVMQQIAQRVQGLASTVELLGKRSDQIGEIIGTIEEIADQTNLLALNAAIEAARAGEQGRGFAVVADEVRALAERTTRATREIGDMIKAIQSETRGVVGAMEEGVREVQSGTSEAARSSSALRDILEQVNVVSGQIAQIASSAEEQTATTGLISGNIQQITTLIVETAQGSHRCAAQAGQLTTCARDLERIIGQFKMG